jgi:Fe-S cluster assembly ATP-binding protein
MLEIKNLHVAVDGKEILKGLSLSIAPGQVHAIMGPNGSGKSTLSYVLAGRAGYDVTEGSIVYNGEDLVALPPEARAAKGVFLAMQYPVEIPGVTTMTFLKTALNSQRRARGESDLDAVGVLKLVRAKAKTLNVSEEMLKRALNVGFSGGEKKRLEILQMAIFEPKLAILDETDSGYRRAASGGRRRQRAARSIARHAGDHPLPAPVGLHRARPHSCLGQGPDCGGRRQGTGAGTGSQGL